MAPGLNVYSTYTGSSYTTLTGTSMSCAHVSGLVALYIAANGRAHSLQDVINIRQAIVNSGQPQSGWNPGGQSYNSITNPTHDPDGNPEPLAIPSENWIPLPAFTGAANTPSGFRLNFPTVPGYYYTVQCSESLASSNQWSNLPSTNGIGSVVTVTVTDPNPATTKFYRLLRQPSL